MSLRKKRNAGMVITAFSAAGALLLILVFPGFAEKPIAEHQPADANYVRTNLHSPLPSWNEPVRTTIIDFVERVTTQDSHEFVPPDQRIAVFDNDGTLWSEKPFYFQLYFALDRVQVLAPKHPEWKTKQPFKAALERDMESLVAAGEEGSPGLLKGIE